MVDSYPASYGEVPNGIEKPLGNAPFDPSQEIPMAEQLWWSSLAGFFQSKAEVQTAEIDTLRQEATQNPVTGLYNEVGFAHRLAEIRGALPDVPVAIIEIDLGNFKGVNDSLGHPVGDQVLRAVASELRNSDAEAVAHPHGDEFRVGAPLIARENTELTNEQRMAAIIERIKSLGNQLCIQIPELSKLGFRVSAGGAVLEPGMRLEDIIPIADSNLYADKEAARRADFMALPFRKRVAHHIGNALVQYSGVRPRR